MSEALRELARRGEVTIFTGPFGSALHADEYADTGVAVIPTEAVAPGRLLLEKIVRIPETKARELDRYRVRPGDIVFARRGVQACGLSAPVRERDGEAIAGTGVIVLRTVATERVNPNYLALAVGAPEAVRWLKHHAVGATMPNLNSAVVLSLPVHLPDIESQRAIAHILGTLDDKIELNRRMNETLEAIAQAIFKSWFIDFDPVRAKASGEPPESICHRLRLTSDILALFPDRLVDSELGEIPEGWAVKPLSQITTYLNRGISPKYIESGGVLVLNQKCVRDGRVDASKARRHDPTQRSVAGRLLEAGDLLVNSTGVGTLGRVAQVLALDELTIVDSHVTVVRADPQQVSWNYLGVALLDRESEIEGLGEGSTGQTELSRVRLGGLKLLVPPEALRKHFDEAVLPLRLQTKRSDEQALTLASIRDAFLPKLLSGEIRVSHEGVA